MGGENVSKGKATVWEDSSRWGDEPPKGRRFVVRCPEGHEHELPTRPVSPWICAECDGEAYEIDE